MSPPSKQIFVVWDSTLTGMKDTLDYLTAAGEPASFTIDALGLTGRAVTGHIPQLLDEKIAWADGVIALVDRPNGNMAWELGAALAGGKRVALGLAGSTVPPWLALPPLCGLGAHK